EGALVSAVRIASEDIAAHDAKTLLSVLEVLESRRGTSTIFTRICLHLLRVATDVPIGIIERHLTQPTYFHELSVRHEYTLLLTAAYGRLSEEARGTILGL